jgi:hypothetical protein
MISIRGCETRLKSKRYVEGGCRAVFAVSCSICICLIPMVRLVFSALPLGSGMSFGSMPSSKVRVRVPFRAKGSAEVSGLKIDPRFVVHTIVLRDLITIWLILVKVVLAIPTTTRLNIAIHSQSRTKSWDKSSFLESRLSSRQSYIKASDMFIRLGIGRGTSSRKELVGSVEFGVHFDADCQLPLV